MFLFFDIFEDFKIYNYKTIKNGIDATQHFIAKGGDITPQA